MQPKFKHKANKISADHGEAAWPKCSLGTFSRPMCKYGNCLSIICSAQTLPGILHI